MFQQQQQQSSQAAGVAPHRTHPHRHPLQALRPHSRAAKTELPAGPSRMAGEQHCCTGLGNNFACTCLSFAVPCQTSMPLSLPSSMSACATLGMWTLS